VAHFGVTTFLVMTLSRTALTRALSRIDVHVNSHNSVTLLLAISVCTVLLNVSLLILVLLNAVLLHVVLLNVSLLSLCITEYCYAECSLAHCCLGDNHL
jgi:hypothetical protein